MSLDVKYLRAIFGVAREKGVSNEELHEAIEAGFGKTSLKKLTKGEALKLMDGMRGKDRAAGSGYHGQPRGRAMALHGRKDYDDSGDVAYRIKQVEMKLLREAAELRGWDEATLRKFIVRQIASESIRTVKQFNKVFWAVKAMNRRDKLHA